MELPKYPKIDWYGRDTPNKACVAFEKYDGTNLAWHWNRESGFQKFYTRRREFNIDDPDFGSSISLFKDLSSDLEVAFSDKKLLNSTDMMVYAEYFGPNSFGGFHNSNDKMELRVLDIWSSQLGFLDPNTFISIFSKLPLPNIIYKGKITGKFSDDIKHGKYDVFEGVVCKGTQANNPWMCKIKTQKWLDRLKQSFTQRWTAADSVERNVSEELEGI